jgi:uncharacterized protein YceK
VTPSGGVASTTLTVTTSTTTVEFRHNSNPLFPGSVLAVALCILCRKRQRRLHNLLLALSVTCLSLLNGCGGAASQSGGSSGTSQPVTSTITVTATAGSIQHTTSLSLTVN